MNEWSVFDSVRAENSIQEGTASQLLGIESHLRKVRADKIETVLYLCQKLTIDSIHIQCAVLPYAMPMNRSPVVGKVIGNFDFSRHVSILVVTGLNTYL